ncbi:Mur ligase family protein [Anaerococcus lactolyticus]|uniref:Lipid II isoglutaminyl synthase (glutamine-hydrolyzing) subunit MurT n=1 Tax=Anaerococcus lactolyticus S7-1-13 TaxID=1284686 RepID=A0A095X342_9FIRM|nr:MurT ligase domain-containing protein [Anaerococcus lactolyticus]KGF04131.1 UDP-N-acetylmuramoylalanyl-D-glutamate--2,6-diaminopimelate ligase [Anaerococcus lactolyticus S7-1-13]
MSLKSKLVKVLAKSIRSTLKLLNRKATSLPGYVAYKLDKDILKELSKNTKFIFVTGTNGKTMTTHFLATILKEHYPIVLTNESGSNMVQGIITSLLDNPPNEQTVAVLEVDEANIVRIGKYLKADYVALTNIFRDQMDRFGEIYNILDKIIEGLNLMPEARIIANGDLPIFSYDKLKKFNPIYFAIRDDDHIGYDRDAEFNSDGIICPSCHSILKYRTVNYSSLGDFACPNCDFKSPEIRYTIDKIASLDPNHSKFFIDGRAYEVNVGGVYNIYNALTALAVAYELRLSYDEIYKGLKKQKNVFGRQENINVFDKNVVINLVKNPTGLNQVIDLVTLEKEPISLICLLNDNYADGLDVSWIYDSYYEKLAGLDIKDIYVSGKRKIDMKRRLEIANLFDGEIIEFDYVNQIKDVIKNAKTDNIYILSTYTAMLKLREVLAL